MIHLNTALLSTSEFPKSSLWLSITPWRRS